MHKYLTKEREVASLTKLNLSQDLPNRVSAHHFFEFHIYVYA